MIYLQAVDRREREEVMSKRTKRGSADDRDIAKVDWINIISHGIYVHIDPISHNLIDMKDGYERYVL